MNLVLLGAPGSGKGTQAKKLGSKYGLVHVSTGDMFRKAVSEKTGIAQRLKSIMEKGDLVPDEIVIGIVKERLSKDDCAKSGYMLDGFPRTIAQAKELDKLTSSNKINLVLYIEVDEVELVRRLSGRRMCASCNAGYHVMFQPPRKEGLCDSCGGRLFQREDDKEATVKQRLKVYDDSTRPLIDYYAGNGVLRKIAGNGSMDEVSKRLYSEIDGV